MCGAAILIGTYGAGGSATGKSGVPSFAEAGDRAMQAGGTAGGLLFGSGGAGGIGGAGGVGGSGNDGGKQARCRPAAAGLGSATADLGSGGTVAANGGSR